MQPARCNVAAAPVRARAHPQRSHARSARARASVARKAGAARPARRAASSAAQPLRVHVARRREHVSRRVGAGLFESVFGVNEDKDLHEFTGILAGVQQALSTITLSATTYGNETFTIRVRKQAHPSWVLANRTRQPEHRIERTLRVRVDEPAKSDQSEKKLPKEVRIRRALRGLPQRSSAWQCSGARAVQVFYFLCAALGLSVLLCCACCIRRRRRQRASVTSRILRKGRPAHKQRFLLDKHAPDGARGAVAVPKLSAQQAAALHHELAADQMAGFLLLGGAVHDARVEALSGHALLLCEAHGSADELLRHAVHAEVGRRGQQADKTTKRRLM